MDVETATSLLDIEFSKETLLSNSSLKSSLNKKDLNIKTLEDELDRKNLELEQIKLDLETMRKGHMITEKHLSTAKNENIALQSKYSQLEVNNLNLLSNV
jgi:hypothetical protein